ncbi:DUF4097 family beta strand repeat-containing protein [Aquimarina sp. RZ0]|uniref:DUF4097 family beta strand repeat-containing protein n=1 Tax=Aquimarina sp. RZ0 TaxID=2607730 RepID=UPI0011F25DC1|nr:DUF4097 family beta strand repeat-containing protein [Aquimarina sp. RZ0]KAA1243643.1 DUF4097 domain-containing protein [Aquimarina sp. RZ0]
MKNIIIVTILFISLSQISAQDYTKSLQGIKKVKIYSATEVTLKAHNKNDLRIIGGEHIKTPEKAKGLKAVYSGGSDNTGLGVSVEREGDVLTVTNLRNIHGPHLDIFVSKSVNILIENTRIGSVNIAGFSSEIEAKTNVGHIIIKDVTGPIVAKSSTGEINIIFNTISQSSPISIVSSTGDVDVSMPSSTPANLNLKTAMGEIYTDFDIKFPEEAKNNMKIIGGKRSISTKLNNGGVDITLRSSTGSIYLRKK